MQIVPPWHGAKPFSIYKYSTHLEQPAVLRLLQNAVKLQHQPRHVPEVRVCVLRLVNSQLFETAEEHRHQLKVLRLNQLRRAAALVASVQIAHEAEPRGDVRLQQLVQRVLLLLRHGALLAQQARHRRAYEVPAAEVQQRAPIPKRQLSTSGALHTQCAQDGALYFQRSDPICFHYC